MRKYFCLVFSLLMLGVSGYGDENKADKDRRMRLRLGHVVSQDNPWHLAALKFAETVERSSGGSLRIYVTSDAKLGSEKDLAEGLREGSVDFAVLGTGTVAQFYPKLNVLSLPYVFRGRDHFLAVINGGLGAGLLEEIGERIKLRGLAFWERGPRYITNSKRPIFSPKDLEGLRIRVPKEALAQDMMAALGAVPVPLHFEETYFALQHGIADGQENPVSLIVSSRISEVQKYLALTGHGLAPAILGMSESLYGKLSTKHREAVKTAAKEAAAYEADLVQKEESALLAGLEKKGLIITRPSKEAFAAALKETVTKYVALYGQDLYDKIKAVPERRN